MVLFRLSACRASRCAREENNGSSPSAHSDEKITCTAALSTKFLHGALFPLPAHAGIATFACVSFLPFHRWRRRYRPILVRIALAVLLPVLLLQVLAMAYVAAAPPGERSLRQRACFLCHTDKFLNPLPCLGHWQAGFPLRQPLRTRLQQVHPVLAGGSSLDSLTDELLSRQLAALAATRQQERGAALYAAKCAACHGSKGQGQAGLYPPLRGSEWLTDTPSRLPEILSRGLRGPISVKGEWWNDTMLPPGVDEPGQQVLIPFLRSSWR